LFDDADEQRLAASLGGDLSTILTRIPLLRITSQALAPRDGMAPSARDLYESLGVDLVLGGTVQRLGDRFRINVQLSDAASGFQLWAEQLPTAGPLADAIEGGVIAIIGRLEPQLQRTIYERVRGNHGTPSARQLFLEANAMLAVQGWHHDSFAMAAELLRRSRALDPGFVLAPASLSLVLGLGERIGLTADSGIKAEALEAAELALRLDAMDACVLGLAGCALADLGYPQRALPILRNAVEIKPANAQAWAALGSVYLMLGQTGQAIECLQRGLSISPLDSRLSIWGALLTLAHLAGGDLDAALQQGDLACQRDDRSYMPRVALAAVHLARADKDSAVAALHDALRIKPDLSRHQITSLVGKRLGTAMVRLKRQTSGGA
jgi:tetratricopeptide (TPR) repeat protein